MKRQEELLNTPTITNVGSGLSESNSVAGSLSNSIGSQSNRSEGRVLGSGNNLLEHLRASAKERLENGDDTIPVIEEYERVNAVDASIIHHINGDPELGGLRRKILKRIVDGNFSPETIRTVIDHVPADLREVIVNTVSNTPALTTYLPILNIALLGGIGLEDTQQMVQNVLSAINGGMTEMPVNPNDVISQKATEARSQIDDIVRETVEENNNTNDSNVGNPRNILGRIVWGNAWRRAGTLLGAGLGLYLGQPWFGPFCRYGRQNHWKTCCGDSRHHRQE